MPLTKVQIGMTDAPTSGTAVTASGTSVDFTGIPSTAKRITVMFSGVSTNGTSNGLVQLGSGSITATGYLGSANSTAGSVTTSTYTTGFGIKVIDSSSCLIYGSIVVTNLTANSWVANGNIGRSDNGVTGNIAGQVTLSGTLDRVRITTVNGTDTFDAGTINIMWE